MEATHHDILFRHVRTSRREAFHLVTGTFLIGSLLLSLGYYLTSPDAKLFRLIALCVVSLICLYVFAYAVYLLKTGGTFTVELSSDRLRVDSPVNDGMPSIEIPLDTIKGVECHNFRSSDSDPRYVLRYGDAGEYTLWANFGINPRKLARLIANQTGHDIIDLNKP
ncbi:hypothetical protein [Algisphaera agarilytica]|uniref:Uncharacterized protein n=1 Tax=Algisphaera agarilytica TaxID=1385975 RepID=A0A7X0H3J5_9BACT|nr:hypothetical protein [Algisphaera agarilytica]MBB6428633.1 hypothetical protein [Algisphaera agarilytica]